VLVRKEASVVGEKDGEKEDEDEDEDEEAPLSRRRKR
tara:strand:+ start:257 stop:367 length:111 start_codon:yes stop_codon:yes gene_type:complete